MKALFCAHVLSLRSALASSRLLRSPPRVSLAVLAFASPPRSRFSSFFSFCFSLVFPSVCFLSYLLRSPFLVFFSFLLSLVSPLISFLVSPVSFPGFLFSFSSLPGLSFGLFPGLSFGLFSADSEDAVIVKADSMLLVRRSIEVLLG